MIYKCTNASGKTVEINAETFSNAATESAKFFKFQGAYHLPIAITSESGEKATISRCDDSENLYIYPKVKR